MAPKKKGNRKQEEDWEAELGESIPPAGGDSPAQEEAPGADGDDGEAGGGGLLAALRKNKNKKAKKGKPTNDFVEGEDPTQEVNGDTDFTSKQPEEGTFDEDDVFAGKKSKPIKAAPPPPAPADEDSGPRVKTKKEKEREKKEREKQRKKEQVCFMSPASKPRLFMLTDMRYPGREEEDYRTQTA
jgi:translation initiation factor 5B